MRDISFGQYYPVSSFIHSIDARIKILVTLLFMVTVFFIVSYTAFVFMFFFRTKCNYILCCILILGNLGWPQIHHLPGFHA